MYPHFRQYIAGREAEPDMRSDPLRRSATRLGWTCDAGGDDVFDKDYDKAYDKVRGDVLQPAHHHARALPNRGAVTS